MSGHKVRPWQPLQRGQLNPAYVLTIYGVSIVAGVEEVRVADRIVEAWGSESYSVVVERHDSGWCYLSIKRQDRHVIRDWRHLQAIKNEIAGAEREAFEIFPAESRLLDQANQYYLWVLPEGETLAVGEQGRQVGTAEQARELNRQHGGKGRQRDWQPGLSTGPVFDR